MSFSKVSALVLSVLTISTASIAQACDSMTVDACEARMYGQGVDGEDAGYGCLKIAQKGELQGNCGLLDAFVKGVEDLRAIRGTYCDDKVINGTSAYTQAYGLMISGLDFNKHLSTVQSLIDAGAPADSAAESAYRIQTHGLSLDSWSDAILSLGGQGVNLKQAIADVTEVYLASPRLAQGLPACVAKKLSRSTRLTKKTAMYRCFTELKISCGK